MKNITKKLNESVKAANVALDKYDTLLLEKQKKAAAGQAKISNLRAKIADLRTDYDSALVQDREKAADEINAKILSLSRDLEKVKRRAELIGKVTAEHDPEQAKEYTKIVDKEVSKSLAVFDEWFSSLQEQKGAYETAVAEYVTYLKKFSALKLRAAKVLAKAGLSAEIKKLTKCRNYGQGHFMPKLPKSFDCNPGLPESVIKQGKKDSPDFSKIIETDGLSQRQVEVSGSVFSDEIAMRRLPGSLPGSPLAQPVWDLEKALG